MDPAGVAVGGEGARGVASAERLVPDGAGLDVGEGDKVGEVLAAGDGARVGPAEGDAVVLGCPEPCVETCLGAGRATGRGTVMRRRLVTARRQRVVLGTTTRQVAERVAGMVIVARRLEVRTTETVRHPWLVRRCSLTRRFRGPATRICSLMVRRPEVVRTLRGHPAM